MTIEIDCFLIGLKALLPFNFRACSVHPTSSLNQRILLLTKPKGPPFLS